MSENAQQGFKRINFFKGFLTTEKDWNDAEKYHIDKRMPAQPLVPLAGRGDGVQRRPEAQAHARVVTSPSRSSRATRSMVRATT
ncbi:MAG: hypothetical protein IPQ07_34885 [Myxococcales bacterium]|nr:hypothetical protein [Myxococcales bacterium]